MQPIKLPRTFEPIPALSTGVLTGWGLNHVGMMLLYIRWRNTFLRSRNQSLFLMRHLLFIIVKKSITNHVTFNKKKKLIKDQAVFLFNIWRNSVVWRIHQVMDGIGRMWNNFPTERLNNHFCNCSMMSSRFFFNCGFENFWWWTSAVMVIFIVDDAFFVPLDVHQLTRMCTNWDKNYRCC